MEGYCVKCKSKRNMKDVKIVTNKKGTRMAKGTCSKCDCKMTVFVKKD